MKCQPISEMKFFKPMHGKVGGKRPKKIGFGVKPLSPMEQQQALMRLKHICPDACVLATENSGTDSFSEDDELPKVL